MQSITHNRGDSFAWGGTVMLASGISWACRSQVRDPAALDGVIPSEQVLTTALNALSGGEIAALGITVPSGSTAFALALTATPAQTLTWPAGYPSLKRLVCDIEFYDPGDAMLIISSPTFEIRVDKGVTRI